MVERLTMSAARLGTPASANGQVIANRAPTSAAKRRSSAARTPGSPAQ